MLGKIGVAERRISMHKNADHIALLALLPITITGCFSDIRHSHPWDTYSAYAGVFGLTMIILALWINQEHKKDLDHSTELMKRMFLSIAISIASIWFIALLSFEFSSSNAFLMWFCWICFLVGLGIYAYWVEYIFWRDRKEYLRINRPTKGPTGPSAFDKDKWEMCPECNALNPKGFKRCLKYKQHTQVTATTPPPELPAPAIIIPTEPTQAVPQPSSQQAEVEEDNPFLRKEW